MKVKEFEEKKAKLCHFFFQSYSYPNLCIHSCYISNKNNNVYKF